jgi:type I restriction enzyme S subunit
MEKQKNGSTEQSRSLPTLRFPEFKGEWEKKKLGEVTNWASGGTPPKDNAAYWNGDIPWISASSMRGTKYSDSELKITKEGLKKGSKLAKAGTLLILVRGSMLFNKIPIGITTKDVAFNQDVKSIIVNEVSESNYILQWFIYSEYKIMNMVTGTGIGAGKLDLDELKGIPISFPTHPEQSRIANFLTAVDEKIQALKKKKGLLEAYKKGVMQRLFLSESGCEGLEDDRIMDSNDDEKKSRILKSKKTKFRQLRFKDENGQAFADWEVKKLGEVCDIIMGQSPDSNTYNSDKIGLPLIQGNADIQDRITNPRNYTTRATKKCEIGDLILTVRAPVGAVAKSIHNACIGRGVCSIRNKSISNIEFIFQFLLNYETKWANLEQGSTFTAVSGIEIKKLTINLPSLSEQTRIANFLSSIDDKIKHTDVQIEKMGVWKKGLLQKMFV